MQTFWNSRVFRLFAGVRLAYSVCPPLLSYNSYRTIAAPLQSIQHGNSDSPWRPSSGGALPVNVDEARRRVWDGSDPQFPRALR